MKRILLAIIFALMGFYGRTQVTLEHTYTASVGLTKLANSGYKYYGMNWTTGNFILYNIDHSVFKTMPITIPTGMYLYSINYVSETLFNTDSKVEFAYIYYSYDTTNLYYTYYLNIVNEDGTVLLNMPGGGYMDIKTTDNGTKMLVYVYDYSVTPYTVVTHVYSLPGTLVTGISNPEIPSSVTGNPYPNPAVNTVTLPYQLPAKTTDGLIILTDATGKVLKSYHVDQNFNDLQIDVSGWPAGLYFYTLQAGNQPGETRKFMVK